MSIECVAVVDSKPNYLLSLRIRLGPCLYQGGSHRLDAKKEGWPPLSPTVVGFQGRERDNCEK